MTTSQLSRLPVVAWVGAVALGWIAGLSAAEPHLEIRVDDGLRIQLHGSGGSAILLETSKDLSRWVPVTTLQLQEAEPVVEFTDSGVEYVERRFYRFREVAESAFAEITAVSTSGGEGSYQFLVTIRSPDLGCDQYADWWEVLNGDGELLYRRVLAHSHVAEQPFTRSGGPVVVPAGQEVVVRAHMHPFGYGPTAWRGSVATGFVREALGPVHAPAAAASEPLPLGCAF